MKDTLKGKTELPRYESVLVTGGAGFIGSHTVDLLVSKGYHVTILDNLDPQVHPRRKTPEYLNNQSALVVGDIRDKKLVRKCLEDTEAVIHLAATVGVGQSMYDVERCIDSNTRGTAVLLDLIAGEDHNVRKLVVASSMSVYGEGKHYCEYCESIRYPLNRDNTAVAGDTNWEPICSKCKHGLRPIATDEDSQLLPASIYAMSKRHQEEMSLLIARTYGVPTVALRFFNAYGPRQALSNPYTGVVAIFLNRILNGKPPVIFEDGHQLRDFIYVTDVSKACLLALEANAADNMPINIGTGRPTSISEIAETLIKICGSDLKPFVSGQFRKGDVRHCYSDISKARSLLNFHAETDLHAGLAALVRWAKISSWGDADSFDIAMDKLKTRKLV